MLRDWASDLSIALGAPSEGFISGELTILDFPLATVKIVLMDQSVVEFKYALFIVNEARASIAVFTEHCGYHVFPFHEASVFIDGCLVYQQAYKSK